MNMKTWSIRLCISLLGWLLLSGNLVYAIPVTITFADQAREVQNLPPMTFVGGGDTIFDTLEINTEVLSGTTPLTSGVTVTAINSADLGTVVPLFPFDDPIFSTPGWFAEIPYDATLAAGTWTITAVASDGMSDTATAGPNTAPALGLVSDVTITGPLLTPTVSWTLPPDSIDLVQFRITDNEAVEKVL